MTKLLEVINLTKTFSVDGRKLVAIDDVSFSVAKGETHGLVGESGSGKSTLGRCILRLTDIDSGYVRIENEDVTSFRKNEIKKWRSNNQIVFQDSFESMNPKYRIEWILAEPLKLHTKMSKVEITKKVTELLEMVQLPGSFASRYTNELSGGQLQRVNIARALATNPKFLVLDEPTSSLDHSVQANILTLLKNLQSDLGLTYLLISHDLEMIANYCDTVSVMYLGKVLESGKIKDVFENPLHPYTQALLSCTLSANPLEKKTQINLQGLPFSPLQLPKGCRFSSRCSHVLPKCLEAQPEMIGENEHEVACFNIQSTSIAN
jgi:oligopeptide/dipeptide ABC transporter ATP-binding protein